MLALLIIANFVFPYLSSFLLYLQEMMPVNVNLEIKVTCFIELVDIDKAKTKLGMLAFLYSGEFVKNSNVRVDDWITSFTFISGLITTCLIHLSPALKINQSNVRYTIIHEYSLTLFG